ncbi:MAG: SCP2 sterol-binding domain-containing protein [Burkholderiales bacterium]|nr:SCP2 sterol-binding domain-containing protein [Burkholderiales bacterium]
MLPHPGILALNHLLEAEAWARDKLKPYAGQCVEFRSPPLPPLRLDILDTGLLRAAAKDAAPNLVVTIGPAALPAALRGEDALMREIGIEGNADLAGTVQYLFRHLRWDIADDLSKVFGDVLAQRMVSESKRFAAWNRDAAEKLAQNFAEYWVEEQPLLARPADVRQFLADVDQLRDDLARLEKRIQILSGKT